MAEDTQHLDLVEYATRALVVFVHLLLFVCEKHVRDSRVVHSIIFYLEGKLLFLHHQHQQSNKLFLFHLPSNSGGYARIKVMIPWVCRSYVLEACLSNEGNEVQ